MENMIKLNFKKAREELGLNDYDELISIYVKKEDCNIDGFNYSIYTQCKGQNKPQLYLKCDLKECFVVEFIEKNKDVE